MKIVLGAGRTPNDIMFVGEAPGYHESVRGIPFVGESGQIQSRYLSLFDLNINSFYRTNVRKTFIQGNPDPTYQEILDWTPTLLDEISEVQPKLIVCVGRFAAQFFLGDSCPPLSVIHGIPHRSVRNDLPECARDSIILPIFHPAAALHASKDGKYDIRAYIRWDYEQVATILNRIRNGETIRVRHDELEGKEFYKDVSGKELDLILHSESEWGKPNIIGLDTEGSPENPWSIQISLKPGTGFLLRKSRKDFEGGIQSLARFLKKHQLIVAMHQASTPRCACYDVVMCRAMGLELQGFKWFDTMYNAYLYRLESQALKVLADRWLGMSMTPYEDLLEGIGRDKQIAYLQEVADLSLPKPSPVSEKTNYGTIETRQPQSISTSSAGILRDIANGKVNKDGPVNPSDRWKKLRESNPEQVWLIENSLGPMPQSTLDDIPLSQATFYACRDADATLRLALYFQEHNPSNIRSLMVEGMQVLPIVERIQSAGMPVSRSYFVSLRDELQVDLDKLSKRISLRYCDGELFNPNSTKQVAALLRRRGLKPAKRTSTGAASTSKLSIEQYRYTDNAIADIFTWREMAHNRDNHCNDVLERAPDTEDDIFTVHPVYKSTTVHTRRLSSTDPNILAIPVRTEMGKKIRAGYIAPPGKIWCGFDLSGIEMRCMAHVSKDPTLCKVFEDRIHPHRYTASNLFKVPSLDLVTDTQKAVGKETNFLVIYGGAYKKLYEKLRQAGITDYDPLACKGFLDGFFSTYPGVGDYRDRVKYECKKAEIVYDHWGMPRYLPGINCRDYEIEGDEERAAVSHRIQGLAQGMIRNSMVWLDKRTDELISAGELDPDCWRLLLHDELIFLVNEGEEEILAPLIMHALTKKCGIELIVPVEAEAHFGKTWADLK